MPGIFAIAYSDGMDLNMFDNYRKLSASEITMHTKIYVYADTRQMQSYDQLYHCMNK